MRKLIAVLCVITPMLAFASTASARTLTITMRGDDVRAVQTQLLSIGLVTMDSVTGYFGTITLAAVQLFQRTYSIVSSGTPASTGYGGVGPKTRAALQLVSSTPQIPQSTNIVTTVSLPPAITMTPPTFVGGSGGGGTNTPCLFNGQTIASGQAFTAYYSALVSSGQSCVQETRTCSNGVLSGSYVNQSCIINTPQSCVFNGQTVGNQSSVNAYQSAVVPYGQSCVQETRTCNSGVLSGSYTNASCAVNAALSCVFSGQAVGNHVSVNAYQTSSVSYGQSCVQETRVCNDGILSGSYQNASCNIGAAPSATVSLLVNSSKSVVVNVGDILNYVWNSTNLSSAKSTFTSDSSSCLGQGTGPFDWNYGNTLNGASPPIPVLDCMAGHTYVLTYSGVNSAGQTTATSVTVRVNQPAVDPATAAFNALSYTGETMSDYYTLGLRRGGLVVNASGGANLTEWATTPYGPGKTNFTWGDPSNWPYTDASRTYSSVEEWEVKQNCAGGRSFVWINAYALPNDNHTCRNSNWQWTMDGYYKRGSVWKKWTAIYASRRGKWCLLNTRLGRPATRSRPQRPEFSTIIPMVLGVAIHLCSSVYQ
jgi:peptidoglycan hydrolase-like protein with peptidoglycan-binding domain